jgi:RNA polymerase sigma-70 factor (ECF subfamily)
MVSENTDDQDRSDMARLASGQDSALNSLMERHGQRLFHYLFRLLQSETEASDLAQESFVRVYQNRSKFDLSKRFSSWLYTIATNLARSVQRYRARHPNVSIEAGTAPEDRGFQEILPDGKPNPSQVLESAERTKAVRQAVAALPEELREALILAIYEEKSQAEIAEIVGCSPKAVEMRIYRARQQLRGSLEKVVSAL